MILGTALSSVSGYVHTGRRVVIRTLAVLQEKTLLKAVETNGWGIGLVFGTQFEPRRSVRGDLYAFVPLTFTFQDDRVFVHTNLGWLREQDDSRRP